MADNVTVSIKVRPLIRREKDSKLTPQWRIRENTIHNVDGTGEPFVFVTEQLLYNFHVILPVVVAGAVIDQHNTGLRELRSDNIFDETVATRELFDRVCRPVLLASLNGINGTIFAYGQTSSGKTYTMMGDETEPGVVPLAAREIFREIELNKDRQFLIRVGYIEIYNEKIFDLLDRSNNANLKVFENSCGDVSVNYKEMITNCPEQVMQHLEEGNKVKRIGDTNMNERSSRSHTIFRITIESREIGRTQDNENDAVQISTLNLVDLAGSERADQTGATGSRLKEGAHINKSLLSLSCVIQKLSENAENQKFINYRDSKLTRILQASLGGNAVTSMICNITPAAFEESYSTLCFANRAKNIKNKPKVNEVLSEAAMMKRLEKEIKRLQEELRSEQSKNSKIKTLELQNAITMRANQIINSQTHLQFDKSRRRTWCPSTASCIPKPIVYEQDTRLMPPPPPFTKPIDCKTPSTNSENNKKDNIFDETVATRELFDRVCRPVLLASLNGINGTIFAYGQTSSGKTYTMMGDETEPGVVPLAAREIFREIELNKDRQFLIRVGYIEIYNEKIFDLLDRSNNANLKVFENSCGDVSVNYKEMITNCPEQVMQHLEEGNKVKRIGDTNMNERSSRSHTIFRITIESREIGRTQDNENDAVQISTLNLVDLAGSERADQTGATGSRLKEGAHINKSLLSLSCVIQKLSENAENQKFINYRDSKLTRILQASLGGNAVTSMICNITPAAFEESYSTLCFANRAKNIKNKPKVNEVLSEAAMMKRLEKEIKRLQEELRSEQSKNSKIKTLELQNAITMRANQIINSQTHLQFDKSRRRTWCPSTASCIPKPIVYEQDTRLMPPPPPFTKPIDCKTPSTNSEVDDLSPVIRPELLGQNFTKDLLARKVRSTTPSRQFLSAMSMDSATIPPNPTFEFNNSDEFVPGELADFGDRSPQSMARDIHTPCALRPAGKRRSRRSSTGDSPANFIDHEKSEVRCIMLRTTTTTPRPAEKTVLCVGNKCIKEPKKSPTKSVGDHLDFTLLPVILLVCYCGKWNDARKTESCTEKN
ncbi:kinesin-II 95 kDa subunit [Culex quinquefasciatus]|uniref:Kinesin-II 95 kDa subunit n=1 Tax=Culex quinquefasciatus TaxID=7176 RepID=B0WY90_CULQU|nr:kinesin-II 95 kDa subunit [Culex quinquefasciatus]|eukprot:XP_001862362.1 kinesin-II 95 kDa subunit [Culex quinquefasciatus]